MKTCEFCENEAQFCYSDAPNGIGYRNLSFSGGLLGISICEVCLFKHIVKFYSGCSIYMYLLDTFSELSNVTEARLMEELQ